MSCEAAVRYLCRPPASQPSSRRQQGAGSGVAVGAAAKLRGGRAVDPDTVVIDSIRLFSAAGKIQKEQNVREIILKSV